jgi:Alg9-like mannosyltransferase family
MDEQDSSGAHRFSPKWLAGLLSLGLIFRLVAAWVSLGLMHPDEHQQYIEQSFRLLHGYGATFLEQDCGLRHPLFTMFLAGILWVEERAGISDPSLLAAGQRLVLAVLSYVALASLAWSVYSRGRQVAGLVLTVLLVGSVDLLFIQVRVMSENAALTVLALSLACWLRRPVAAGLLLGTMVALRLQTAPLAIGLWAVAGWDARTTLDGGRRWAALTAGLAGALVAMGGMDAAYYGEWFHSTRTSLRLQAGGDLATSFGTSPVYAYVLTGGIALFRASVVALPALALGAWRRPALAAMAGLFFVAHTAIPHKEARFLWPMVPLVGLMIAAGVEAWHRRRPIGRAAAIAVIATLLVPSLVRVGQMPWRVESYAASNAGLARAGRAADLRGVVLIGMPRFLAGNYFYLRVPAPIHYVALKEQQALAADPAWLDGRLNYVVAPRDGLSPALRDELRLMAVYRGWGVYVHEPAGSHARVIGEPGA